MSAPARGEKWRHKTRRRLATVLSYDEALETVLYRYASPPQQSRGRGELGARTARTSLPLRSFLAAFERVSS
jgi:hypothetical protein